MSLYYDIDGVFVRMVCFRVSVSRFDRGYSTCFEYTYIQIVHLTRVEIIIEIIVFILDWNAQINKILSVKN